MNELAGWTITALIIWAYAHFMFVGNPRSTTSVLGMVVLITALLWFLVEAMDLVAGE